MVVVDGNPLEDLKALEAIDAVFLDGAQVVCVASRRRSRSATLARSACAHAWPSEGLDALLLGCKGHWWTGRGACATSCDFHLWGHDGMILLPLDGEPAAVVTSPAVAGMIARHGWIGDMRGDVFLVPPSLSAVRARGLERAAIGTSAGDDRPGAASRSRARERCRVPTSSRPTTSSTACAWSKSALEIEQNRELWDLAQAVDGALRRGAPAGRAAAASSAAEAAKVALAGGARDVLF